MNLIRFILAVAWTAAWGGARWIGYALGGKRWRQRMAFSWSRWASPKPMRCGECGWVGPLRWAVHTYAAAGYDDVEPVDNCPSCGGVDSLRPLMYSRQKGWLS